MSGPGLSRWRPGAAARVASARACAGLVALLATLPGCKRPAPPAPPSAPDAAAELLVGGDAALLFTYADEHGEFRTVDRREDVPAHARRLVRVVDPAGAPPDGAGLVYVLDLTELDRKSPVAARAAPRELFETRALALLAPGASSALADAPAGDAPEREPADAGAPAPAAGPGAARVVLYGTSWCGACRSARAWFLRKGIPFLDKDIERDEAAAAELRDKAARLGVQADRVPVLDVNGRLMIGFDPGRVERILALTASGGTAL